MGKTMLIVQKWKVKKHNACPASVRSWVQSCVPKKSGGGGAKTVSSCFLATSFSLERKSLLLFFFCMYFSKICFKKEYHCSTKKKPKCLFAFKIVSNWLFSTAYLSENQIILRKTSNQSHNNLQVFHLFSVSRTFSILFCLSKGHCVCF